MEVISDKELFGLLQEINKARESRQGKADAAVELLFEFTTALVERRTRAQSVLCNRHSGANMGSLEVYRHEPDSFSKIARVDSIRMARTIVHSSATNPLDEFLIYDAHTKEGIILRADGYWFPAPR